MLAQPVQTGYWACGAVAAAFKMFSLTIALWVLLKQQMPPGNLYGQHTTAAQDHQFQKATLPILQVQLLMVPKLPMVDLTV